MEPIKDARKESVVEKLPLPVLNPAPIPDNKKPFTPRGGPMLDEAIDAA